MAEWKEYNGSDGQIAELKNTKHGYVVRRESGEEVCFLSIEYKCRYEDVVSYWIIPDDPLREMKIRQAVTGQPVWVKMKSSTYWVIAMRGFDLIYQDHVVSVIKSTTPDWNIPNAEYSFTAFEEEI